MHACMRKHPLTDQHNLKINFNKINIKCHSNRVHESTCGFLYNNTRYQIDSNFIPSIKIIMAVYTSTACH